MNASTPSENNYLYYVIVDSDKKVRGHVIGVQHWVEPKDQNFNPRILEAIDRAAKVVLEIPPNAPSPLLPSEEESKLSKDVINQAIKHIKFVPNPEVSSDLISSEAEIKLLLKNIEEKGVKAGDKIHEGYKEIKKILDGIQSSKEKLIFLKEIQKNIFDFNLVSLERNINKRIVEKKKIFEPLEKEDLNEKLSNARLKVGLTKIKEKTSEADYQNMLKQLNKIESDKERFTFIDKQKSLLGIKDDVPDEKKARALQKAVNKAWVNGETEKLRDLLTESFELFIEEPEIDQVHKSRDKQMADRIIEEVKEAQAKDADVAIMMGCAHLVYKYKERTVSVKFSHLFS